MHTLKTEGDISATLVKDGRLMYVLTLRYRNPALEELFIDHFWFKRIKYLYIWMIISVIAISAAFISPSNLGDISFLIRSSLIHLVYLILSIYLYLNKNSKSTIFLLKVFIAMVPILECMNMLLDVQAIPECSAKNIDQSPLVKDQCMVRSIGYPSVQFSVSPMITILFMALVGIRWVSLVWGRLLLCIVGSIAIHKDIELRRLFALELGVKLGEIASLFLIYTIEKQERLSFYHSQMNISKQKDQMLSSLRAKKEQERKAVAAFKGVKIKMQNMLLLASLEPIHLSLRLEKLLAKARGNILAHHSKSDFLAMDFAPGCFTMSKQINVQSPPRWKYSADSSLGGSVTSSSNYESKGSVEDEAVRSNSFERFVSIQIGYLGSFDFQSPANTKGNSFPTSELCVIKTIEPIDTLKEIGLHELLNRIFQMCSVKHESIVKTYGYSIQNRVCTYHEYFPIVKEKCLYLSDIVTAAKTKESSKPSLLFTIDCMLQVANALGYLHRKDIAHGNVFLSSIYIASLDEVADSGEILKATCKLSEVSINYIFSYASNSYNLSPGRRKTQIEQGKKSNPIYLSPSTDIFQFGCCFWELLTFDQPVLDAISPLALGENVPSVLVQLILDCLDKNSSVRPGINEVKRLLNLVRADLYFRSS